MDLLPCHAFCFRKSRASVRRPLIAALGDMASDLPLLIGGVGLVRGSVSGLGPALAQLSQEIGGELDITDWTRPAPFWRVSLIIRYGERALPEPEIGPINQYGELEAAIQTSISELRAPRGDVDLLKAAIRPLVKECLSAVGEKYGLRDFDA